MHFIGTTKDLRICLILRMPGRFAESTLREMKRTLRWAQDDTRTGSE